jgi:hypothetical protein
LIYGGSLFFRLPLKWMGISILQHQLYIYVYGWKNVFANKKGKKPRKNRLIGTNYLSYSIWVIFFPSEKQKM